MNFITSELTTNEFSLRLQQYIKDYGLHDDPKVVVMHNEYIIMFDGVVVGYIYYLDYEKELIKLNIRYDIHHPIDLFESLWSATRITSITGHIQYVLGLLQSHYKLYNTHK